MSRSILAAAAAARSTGAQHSKMTGKAAPANASPRVDRPAIRTNPWPGSNPAPALKLQTRRTRAQRDSWQFRHGNTFTPTPQMQDSHTNPARRPEQAHPSRSSTATPYQAKPAWPPAPAPINHHPTLRSESMTWVDLAILAVLVISGLLAFLRGFVREVLRKSPPGSGPPPWLSGRIPASCRPSTAGCTAIPASPSPSPSGWSSSPR